MTNGSQLLAPLPKIAVTIDSDERLVDAVGSPEFLDGLTTVCPAVFAVIIDDGVPPWRESVIQRGQCIPGGFIMVTIKTQDREMFYRSPRKCVFEPTLQEAHLVV